MKPKASKPPTASVAITRDEWLAELQRLASADTRYDDGGLRFSELLEAFRAKFGWSDGRMRAWIWEQVKAGTIEAYRGKRPNVAGCLNSLVLYRRTAKV